MAERGGVSKRSQIDYEQDKIEMKASYMTALSNAGVDVTYVLTGKRSLQGDLGESEEFVLSVLRRLDPFAKQAIAVIFERLAALPATEGQNARHDALESNSKLPGNDVQ